MATRQDSAERAAREAAEGAGLKDGPDPAPAGAVFVASFPKGITVAVEKSNGDGSPVFDEAGRRAVDRVFVPHLHEVPDGVSGQDIATLLSLNYVTAKIG